MGQAKTKKTEEQAETTEEPAAAPKAPTLEEARDLLARMNPEDRVALIDEMVSELPVDPEIEEAQLAEVQRRIEELKSGKVKPLKMEAVMTNLRGFVKERIARDART